MARRPTATAAVRSVTRAARRLCVEDDDCLNGTCDLATSTCAVMHCADGMMDASETGVDCGGPTASCLAGQGCMVGADCASLICAGTTCAAPTCTDGVRNGW